MARSAVLPPVRCHDLELQRWQAAARLEGMTLSEWVRRVLGEAADYTLAKRPTTTAE